VAVDKVQPLKTESIAAGGDSTDEFPTAMDPQKDHVETAGIVFDDATHKDESTRVWRDGDNLQFKDTANSSGASLTTILTAARTPTAHASTHKSGGSDVIKLDELAAPTDVTSLNVTTSAHGLTPKLPNDSNKYLNGIGTYTTPSGTNVFGYDFQQVASEGDSTTTSSTFQDKVSLVSPALTGTYRVAFYCESSCFLANRSVQLRLYNSTDATELCLDEQRPSLSALFGSSSGFQFVTFTGSSKTFKVQYASSNGATQVTIRRARIEFWRVS
jgi:hypothetical protein